ncbi:MAG: hypothetical protein IPM37_24015 [Hahellaceae bacterium]|nr:hypothetical protein [Hahellaceae bacterium]
MYIKITKSGPRRYVQLVEAYRDDQGNPRQRTVATPADWKPLPVRLTSVDQWFAARHWAGATGETPEQTLNFEFSKALVIYMPCSSYGSWDLMPFGGYFVQASAPRCRVIIADHGIQSPEKTRFKAGVVVAGGSNPDGDTRTVGHHHLLGAMDAVVKAKDAGRDFATTLRPLDRSGVVCRVL